MSGSRREARGRLGFPVGFDDDLDRIDESDRAVRLRPALASALCNHAADAVRSGDVLC